MKKPRMIVLLTAGLIVAGVATKSSADYVIKDANSITQTVFAYVCAASKICPASVPTNSSGVEIGTSSTPIRTDPTGTTTQPVSATVLPLPSGASTAANQATGNASLATITSNQTAVQGSKTGGTAAASSLLSGGVYNSVAPTLTNGQQAAFQFDVNGNLKTSGGGGGGGAITAASGSYSSGAISSGAVVDLGSQADAQCGTPNGSCSLIALMKYNNSAVGNSIAAGTAIIGKVGIDQTTDGTTNAVHLTAGTNLVGKFGIDQTTPGTTNGVQVNAALPAGTNLLGKTGIDQTTPGTTNNVTVSYGSAAVVDNPCQTVAKNFTPISVTTATTTRIIAPASGKKTYVCSIVLQVAAADNVGVVEGTGGTCGTGTAGIFGGTTAGSGLNLAANEGWSGGNGQAPILATAGTNVDFCLITSAATNLAGHVTWVQK